jgi:hypothetical protein
MTSQLVFDLSSRNLIFVVRDDEAKWEHVVLATPL